MHAKELMRRFGAPNGAVGDDLDLERLQSRQERSDGEGRKAIAGEGALGHEGDVAAAAPELLDGARECPAVRAVVDDHDVVGADRPAKCLPASDQ